ncbi:hypothetical protein MKW92_010988, partial [Papaver armeniacum]
MVEERNRIKGKGKLPVAPVVAGNVKLATGGQLVIKEDVTIVGIDEAVRRLEEAKEHQLKANSLLDFNVNIKEPERKKRRYKRR